MVDAVYIDNLQPKLSQTAFCLSLLSTTMGLSIVVHHDEMQKKNIPRSIEIICTFGASVWSNPSEALITTKLHEN
jgi:hypothetical protein